MAPSQRFLSKKFDQKLVLFQYLLSLFGAESFEDLAQNMKDPRQEGYDENNTSRFYYALVSRTIDYEMLSKDDLLRYDENIFSHTQKINEKRDRKIVWKYFQYLSLLFTEMYLDRYFSDAEKFLQNLNAFGEKFQSDFLEKEIPPFELSDLKKIAFWNATGSGKTLLMHIHFLQIQHSLEKCGRTKEKWKFLLITPNEGLTNQHLEECEISGIHAQRFVKEKQENLFSGNFENTLEVLEISKLKEADGEKTIAIENFEGNNIVFIDEGHRGSSGDVWKTARDELSKNGLIDKNRVVF